MQLEADESVWSAAWEQLVHLLYGRPLCVESETFLPLCVLADRFLVASLAEMLRLIARGAMGQVPDFLKSGAASAGAGAAAQKTAAVRADFDDDDADLDAELDATAGDMESEMDRLAVSAQPAAASSSSSATSPTLTVTERARSLLDGGFGSWIGDALFHDCTLVAASGARVPAHRILLRVGCDFFARAAETTDRGKDILLPTVLDAGARAPRRRSTRFPSRCACSSATCTARR